MALLFIFGRKRPIKDLIIVIIMVFRPSEAERAVSSSCNKANILVTSIMLSASDAILLYVVKHNYKIKNG